jgi:hypothetical protein
VKAEARGTRNRYQTKPCARGGECLIFNGSFIVNNFSRLKLLCINSVHVRERR